MNFIAFNPFIKQLRSDHGWRIELDVSEDQYDLIKDLPKLQDKTFKVSVEIVNSEIYGSAI